MITPEKKEALRRILASLSTKEELKEFDATIFSKKNEELKKELLNKIEAIKPNIDWNVVAQMISKTESSIAKMIEEVKLGMTPAYNDSKLVAKLNEIESGLKKNPLIEQAKAKKDEMMLDELIKIANVLIDTQEVIKTKEGNKDNEKLATISESLEGIGNVLIKILSKTGSNDSVRIKDSTGTVVEPATATLQTAGNVILTNIKTDTGNIKTDADAIKLSTDNLNSLPNAYSMRYLPHSTLASISYIGLSAAGSAESSAVWQIKKIDETTGAVIKFADGDNLFNNKWSDRETLSYS